MTILSNYSSGAARHPATTTLLFAMIGFLCGLLLSLLLSAYSLYSCIAI